MGKLNPLHYFGLLEQRSGAFEHAIPLRRWRQDWPAAYEQMLDSLRQNKPGGQGVREFIAILKLITTIWMKSFTRPRGRRWRWALPIWMACIFA